MLMQIDRIKLARFKPVYMVIGSSRVSMQVIDQNQKIPDFYDGQRCPLCHMIKDVGEKGICKYCTGDF